MSNSGFHLVRLVAVAIAFVTLSMNSLLFGQSLTLVPTPTESSVSADQTIALPAVISVSLTDDAAWQEHLKIVAVHIERMTGGAHRLEFVAGADALLQVRKDESLSTEASNLKVADDQILIEASSMKGLAHGTATLLQVIGCADNGKLPHLQINDAPKLAYRNFMIDMGRNPHSLQLLKETIDLLWYYKVDSVQLHLTDDQRIAFPSKAFPKIWDGKITFEQFKELEAYAVARGVTIIPELEVPGHSGLLRGRYPDVFGTTPTDLAKNDAALEGIKTLLDEMMEVFASSPYIHIGGDEAFGVPEELQRDLINKLHAYLKSKGRQTIVWEGPRPGTGENKVNTEVIHLNWRTINYPADKMLEDGYRVVNAAWDPLYIVDHYPRINFTMTSPQHIYETMKLTRFKHVNPGITTFAKPVEVQPSDRLIGFCMPWWEGREENFLPQNVPRLIPFAEVAWNPSVKRDFAGFTTRVEKTEAARQLAFYPATIKSDDLTIPADGVFQKNATVDLSWSANENRSDVELRYTLDGSAPQAASMLYEKPIDLTKTTTVRAAVFADGKQIGHGSRRNFTAVQPEQNLALGKPVTSSVSSASPFSVERITDGGKANLDFYLGYPAEPKPVEVTIDLEESQEVSRIVVVAYTISGSFEKYTVEVSTDGKTFEEVATRMEKPEEPTPVVEHKFPARQIRFVRIKSHGNKGYVFDSFSKLVEVQVYE